MVKIFKRGKWVNLGSESQLELVVIPARAEKT